jgi:2-polyprenyl-3-methyl-5-hydroxy-6-metoxy-1,4-benzoquinol methylase
MIEIGSGIKSQLNVNVTRAGVLWGCNGENPMARQMADDDPVSEAGVDIRQALAAWWNGDPSPSALPLPALIAAFAHSSFEDIRRKLSLWWHGGVAPEDELPPVEMETGRPVMSPHKKHQEITARGQVAQVLWGEGNLTPGPSGFIQEITHSLVLTPELSMLDLGAGLGGPARAISAATKVWITAYEAVPEYVKYGMEQSIMHGMGKKVPITEFHAETVKLPKQKFNCVFSKEMMHHIQDKPQLLRKIQETLKPSGQFFFTNYVVTGTGDVSSIIASWNEADGQESHFWSEEEYKAAFSAAKLDLRVSENLTPRYCEMIADGFRSLRQKMDELLAEETDPERRSELLHALAFETKRWAVRAEALQSGEIAVFRFSGLNTDQAEIR